MHRDGFKHGVLPFRSYEFLFFTNEHLGGGSFSTIPLLPLPHVLLFLFPQIACFGDWRRHYLWAAPGQGVKYIAGGRSGGATRHYHLSTFERITLAMIAGA
jgi:hypothetical protein